MRKNFHHTIETKKRLSEHAKKGIIGMLVGGKHSEETKRKISLAHKGKKLSENTKRKMSRRMKKEWREGKTKGFYKGHPSYLTEESKRKIGQAVIKRYDKIGRKKHKRYYHLINTAKYKLWRKTIFERDNYTCQVCRKVGIYLVAHHIKSWAKYPKLRYNINNGITLCLECHKLTPNFKGKAIKKHSRKLRKITIRQRFFR